MQNALLWIQHLLRPVSLTALARDHRVMKTARTLVAYYYYVLPLLAFSFLTSDIIQRVNFEPIWPLAWAHVLNLESTTVVIAIQLFVLLASFLAVPFHRFRFVRLLVFLAIWQLHALESSFGAPNHQWYMWVYSSLIFVFLPDIWSAARASFERNRSFLLLIWFTQAIAMLSYTMAGLHKLKSIVVQWRAGEIHGLAPEAFAYQIADWVPLLQESALAASLIVQHPLVGWGPYLLLHVLQIFALWTMVRPSLQKFWALWIVIFHVGTFLTMGISFFPLMLFVIIMFFNTPFAPEHVTVHMFLRDLPIIGPLFDRDVRNRLRTRARTIVHTVSARIRSVE